MPLSSLFSLDQCCAMILLAAGPMIASAILRRPGNCEQAALVKLMLITTVPGCGIGTLYGQLEGRYLLMSLAWLWFLGWFLGAALWRGERIARVDRTDAAHPDTVALQNGTSFTIRDGKPEQLP